MISASPTHANALRAFVRACLNLDDDGQPIAPEPFPEAAVIWSDRDHPRPVGPYCMLREVAFVPKGPTEIAHRAEDPGGPSEALAEYHRDQAEWTVSVHLVSLLDAAAPAHADQAGALLRRVWSRTETQLAAPMRAIGCAPLRRGQILPLSRIARMSAWESRAAFDLTLSVGLVIVDRPGWIESVEGTGTLAPLADPVTFDATDPT